MFKRLLWCFRKNEKAFTTLSSVVQSVAVVIAGAWICGVFFYTEVVKPSRLETFLSPTLQLVKVGVEKDSGGVVYFVMSLDFEMQNNSGQKIKIPSSFFIVSGEKYSSKVGSFTVDDVQRSVNGFRGGRARYKGNAEFSEFLYVGSEYSGWQLAVGEKLKGSRLFRVRADRYDQLVADWFVLRRNADLEDIMVSQVVTQDSTYEYAVDSCGCIGKCPDISTLQNVRVHSGNCPAPWIDLSSPEGDRFIGDREKTGKITLSASFLVPAIQ